MLINCVISWQCWGLQLVNKEQNHYKKEQQSEFPLSCLIEIQHLFSLQPPTHSRTTTRERCGRQEEKERSYLVSSRNGTLPQNASLAPPPFCLPMSISPLQAQHHRHTLLLHPWLLPWQLFVFQCSLSEKDCLSRSSNHPFHRTNPHVGTHYSNNATVLI